MRHVDANHMPGLANLAGCQEAIKAGAAAEIDDSFARLEIGDPLRVAAAKAEIGTFRHGRELLGGIAPRQRFRVRWRRGSAAGCGRGAAARLCRSRFGDTAIADADHFLDVSLFHIAPPLVALPRSASHFAGSFLPRIARTDFTGIAGWRAHTAILG